MLVKIARYYSYPDINKQTPNNNMIWNGITFTEDDVEACDFLIILDYPKNDFSVKVNKNNIFHFCLEPSNEVSKYRQFANKNVSKIFNQLKEDKKIELCYPALPWHIGLSYDELKQINVNQLHKENKIVWVTSNQRTSIQHNFRMDFLDSINNLPFVELYGKGIQPIDSKWDVMKSSKYAIAFENFKNNYNWTEKIADCFLSYNIPIYYGCDSISNYFNPNSIIQLDPNDKHIDLKLKEIVASNYWEKNLDALIESRNLVLEKYQMFALFETIIQNHQTKFGVNSKQEKTKITFKGQQDYFDNYPFSVYLEKETHKLIRKIKGKFL